MSLGRPRRDDHGILPEPGADLPPPFPARRGAARLHPQADAPLAGAHGNLAVAPAALPATRPPMGGPPSRDQQVSPRRPCQTRRSPAAFEPAAPPGDPPPHPRPREEARSCGLFPRLRDEPRFSRGFQTDRPHPLPAGLRCRHPKGCQMLRGAASGRRRPRKRPASGPDQPRPFSRIGCRYYRDRLRRLRLRPEGI